nr:protein elicitor protein [Colletotrichum truncatum]KAF6782763.1 protein elicitor protein [Colletotrichum truncatum]
MHFNSAVLITALVASVAAAPQRDNADPRTQRVIVNDFSARHKLDGTVESVGLHITGPDAGEIECSKSDGVVLGEKYKCGDSKYSFALIEGVFDTWGIRVYHQWGVAEWSFWQQRCSYHMPRRPPPNYHLHCSDASLVLYWRQIRAYQWLQSRWFLKLSLESII